LFPAGLGDLEFLGDLVTPDFLEFLQNLENLEHPDYLILVIPEDLGFLDDPEFLGNRLKDPVFLEYPEDFPLPL
jgi:hypothetical protein